jgi:hypothetical protein
MMNCISHTLAGIPLLKHLYIHLTLTSTLTRLTKLPIAPFNNLLHLALMGWYKLEVEYQLGYPRLAAAVCLSYDFLVTMMRRNVGVHTWLGRELASTELPLLLFVLKKGVSVENFLSVSLGHLVMVGGSCSRMEGLALVWRVLLSYGGSCSRMEGLALV